MEKLENLLQVAGKFNVDLDTETLGYYWYKVTLMNNIFALLMVVVVVGIISYFVYLGCKYINE